MPQEVYRFGPYRLDSRTRLLWQAGDVVPLRGREFETLHTIASRLGAPVDKYQILKEIWPDNPGIHESNVTTQVRALRKKLGKDASGQEYIRNISNQGYFISCVVVVPAEAEVVPGAKTGDRPESEGELHGPVISAPDESLRAEDDHVAENAVTAGQVISPLGSARTHSMLLGSTNVVRAYMAVSAVAIMCAIAALGVIWRAYGLTIPAFWLGVLVIILAYPRLPDAPATRSLAALFLLAAMSYTASVTTLPEVTSTVVNLAVIPPAAAYPFVMGLKYVPLFFVVLAYWVLLVYRRDRGFLSSPLLGKAYISTGILVLLITCVCVASASREDRVWQANLPGRWTIVLGYAVVFVLNLAAWIAGHHYYKQESIASYRRLFSICAILYLPVAVTAFLVDSQFNRINRYYLDVRWPEAYMAANPDAANEVESLTRGSLSAKVGTKLQSVLRDPVFRQVLQHGILYKQHFDEPFQVFDRAVILGYRRPSQGPHRRLLPFVVIRFPKELADAFRFELVSEDK